MIAQSLDGRRLAGPTGGEPDEGPPGSKRFDGRQCRGDDQIVPVDGVGDGRTHPTAFVSSASRVIDTYVSCMAPGLSPTERKEKPAASPARAHRRKRSNSNGAMPNPNSNFAGCSII